MNYYHQLGDGTTTGRTTPVDVTGLEGEIAAIAVGGLHTCALARSGGVKCWGTNWHGELGDGTTTSRSTAKDVSGLTSGVLAVTAGEAHTCALMDAAHGGGIKCWGANTYGQLGDGTIQGPYDDGHLTPRDVRELASGVVAVAACYYHTCALTGGGRLQCWGGNPFGQLGDGSRTDRVLPVDVTDLASGVAGVTGGGQHTCAVMDADHGSGVRC